MTTHSCIYLYMHLMHPNYCQITILLVVDLRSSLAYYMMTQPLPIAGKLPIKTLVARQLPTNVYKGNSLILATNIRVCVCACMHAYVCTYMYISASYSDTLLINPPLQHYCTRRLLIMYSCMHAYVCTYMYVYV